MIHLPTLIREEMRKKGLYQRELAERATAERKKMDPFERKDAHLKWTLTCPGA